MKFIKEFFTALFSMFAKKKEVPVENKQTLDQKLRAQIIIENQKYNGKRETGGKNRAPWIDEINTWSGAGLGEPYCIGGALFCVSKACKALGLKNPCGNNPGTQSWFRNAPEKFKHGKGYKPRLADICIEQQRANSGKGHAYTISSVVTDIKKMKSLEFNTDGSGGRDGDGFYPRVRSQDGDDLKKYLGSVDVVAWIIDRN